MCYSVDCAYNYGQALDYASLIVYVKKLDSTGTMAVSGRYAHKVLSISGISVSFGDDTQITFTPTTGYNYMAADYGFSY